MTKDFSRRDFFRASALTLLATTGAAAIARDAGPVHAAPPLHPGHGNSIPSVVGEVNHQRNGFDPTDVLTDFDYGLVSQLDNGQTLREYSITAVDKRLEIVPGLEIAVWAYNGRIPGPTIRCVEGDVVRIHFTNAGTQPHTMHFHGSHIAEMDGVPGSGAGVIYPGQTFAYEFEAGPVGLHLYHSHNYPVSLEIVKGLYGAFIVEPKDGWPAAAYEMVLVMNGFDLDNDGRNEFYALNSIPFHYQKHAIPIKVNSLVRLFVLNMVEFDLLNSFHLHGNFFNYYPTGTSPTSGEFTDTIMLAQAQRGILEFSYTLPGLYLFRSQINRFAEAGAFGLFQVDF